MSRQGSGTHSKHVVTENEEFGATITIEYSWHYEPGRDRLSNGDPGYPESSDIEITDWYDEDGNKPEQVTDEMLNEILDDANIDFWEEPEPDDYEPDFDGPEVDFNI
jgi:hypothetical protein